MTLQGTLEEGPGRELGTQAEPWGLGPRGVSLGLRSGRAVVNSAEHDPKSLPDDMRLNPLLGDKSPR